MEQITVLVGAKDLLNIAPSWNAIAARVREYPFFELLDICGRLSAVIHNSKESHDFIQMAFCGALNSSQKFALLSRRVELMRYRRARDEEGPSSPLSFVSNRTLLVLLQVASQVCDLHNEAIVHGPYDNLFEAMLIANDLINSSEYNPTEAEVATQEGMRHWIYYLTIIAAEPGAQPPVHLLSRATELFFRENPELANHPDFLDLNEVFERTTGLSIHSYVLAFLSLVAPLYRIDTTNFMVESAAVPHTFFTNDQLRFTPTQIRSFFDLTGFSVEGFIAEMQTAYERDAVKPFYYLPFEKSPIVDFAGAAVCSSLPLLERKLTSGIYHILFDTPKHNGDVTYKPKFQRFFGAIFARYVSDTFLRIGKYEDDRLVKGNKTKLRPSTWISEMVMQQALNFPEDKRPRLCDGLLLIRDTIFAVEIKAKVFSLGARSGSDEEAFFSRMEEIAIDSADQINSTIAQIAGGNFASLGIAADSIRRVFPLVISLQELFLNKPLALWLNARLSAERLLTQSNVSSMRIYPLELLDVSDLEWMELVVEHGSISIREVFEKKHESHLSNAISLRNWGQLHRVGRLDPSARPSYHAANFEKVSNGALSFFRAHSSHLP
jgi:hypothetical protein